MTINTNDKETRDTQVAEQVNRLQDEITKLSDEISKLRSRLVHVLKDRQLSPDEEKKHSLLVPLATTLRDCVERVDISTSEITEMINLLEV